MSLYEERLSKDLSQINDAVAGLGARVEQALINAVKSSLDADRALANRTVIGDHPINRTTREITRLCYAFLAVHQPSAGHLRQISSIVSLVGELERIGDYAVTIAREALQLPHPPSGVLRQEMEDMAEQAQTCLERSVAAFKDKNVELARETLLMASQAKGRGDMIYADLVDESEKKGERIRYLFDMLITIGRLKRVSDRAKNICEETLFTITGETKPPKVYRVLFLDHHNNCQSQIAEAVARRTFPHSGEFSSAGRSNAADLTPGLFRFLESQGLALGPIKPKVLEPDVEKAAGYDVIVSLSGPITDYLPGQPFRTVFLEWDVGSVPEGLTEADAGQSYLPMHREISARVRDLMETLRGAEAN
ncbi:MAG: phosphate signaling complex protein PhoU [Kiloniellales bacterium]|nr:phosphate signaling complex protein PhoU [Kiloniellales bacterium]